MSNRKGWVVEGRWKEGRRVVWKPVRYHASKQFALEDAKHCTALSHGHTEYRVVCYVPKPEAPNG